MPEAETSISPKSLEQALDKYANGSLLRIAMALRIAERGQRIERGQVIARLAKFLGTPDHLTQLDRLLSPAHWHALGDPALRHGASTVIDIGRRLRGHVDSDEAAFVQLQLLFDSGALVIVAPNHREGDLSPTAKQLERGYLRGDQVSSFPAVVREAELRIEAAARARLTPITPDRVVEADSSALRRDAYLILQAAGTGIRLTTKLTPYKNDLRAIIAAVSPKTSAKGSTRGQAKAGARPASPSRDAPLERAWFAAAALIAAGALKAQLQAEYSLSQTGLARSFLEGSSVDQTHLLYDGWLRCRFSELARVPTLAFNYGVNTDNCWVEAPEQATSKGDLPDVDQLARARATIVETLRRAGARLREGWVPIAGFKAMIRMELSGFLVPAKHFGSPRYAYPYYHYDGILWRGKDGRSSLDADIEIGPDGWNRVEGAYIEQVVREPLHWLGLVDLGLDSSGRLIAFRLTPTGRRLLLGDALEEQSQEGAGAPELVVQPNFELVVLDALSHMPLLSRLDAFAERQSVERAATYRLTKESLARGLAIGMTGADIVRELETASRAPLPQNVAYTIADWSWLYDRVHLRTSVTLLVADSPNDLRSWTQNERVQSAFDHLLSPTVALVKAGARGKVEPFLERRGAPVRVVDYGRPAREIAKLVSSTLIEIPAKHDELYLRYRLGQIADERPGAKHTIRYELTPESVRRAVTLGRSPDEVLGYLEEITGADLSTETEIRVSGWGGAYPPVRYQSVVLFHASADGPTWPELATEPAVAEAVIGVIGDSIALVEPAKLDAVRKALSSLGIELTEGIAPAGPDSDSGASAPTRGRYARRTAPADAGLGPEVRVDRMAMALAMELIEKAYVDGTDIVVKARTTTGSVEAMTLRPVVLYNVKGKLMFDGLCRDCAKTHTVALEDVVDVSNVAGPTRQKK